MDPCSFVPHILRGLIYAGMYGEVSGGDVVAVRAFGHAFQGHVTRLAGEAPATRPTSLPAHRSPHRGKAGGLELTELASLDVSSSPGGPRPHRVERGISSCMYVCTQSALRAGTTSRGQELVLESVALVQSACRLKHSVLICYGLRQVLWLLERTPVWLLLGASDRGKSHRGGG